MATALPGVRTLSPRAFLGLSLLTCAALFLVVTSGAFVRLTGSGLGCENWPRCGDKPYPEQGFHAFVEFGNRMVALAGIILTLVTLLASRSGVRVMLEAEALPALPGALELAASGVRTGGDRRNREFAERHVESTADPAVEALAFDPQTAGGLLVSLPVERAAVLEATLAAEGISAARIGRVEAGSGVGFG